MFALTSGNPANLNHVTTSC